MEFPKGRGGHHPEVHQEETVPQLPRGVVARLLVLPANSADDALALRGEVLGVRRRLG